MSQFIYAFGKDEREELERLGYEIVQKDDARGIYVFLNSGALDFSAYTGRFAMSDTLTF